MRYIILKSFEMLQKRYNFSQAVSPSLKGIQYIIHLLLSPRHRPVAFGPVPFVVRTLAIRTHRPTAPFAPHRRVRGNRLQASQTHGPGDLRRAPDQRPLDQRHLPRGQVHVGGHVPADRRIFRHLKDREDIIQ